MRKVLVLGTVLATTGVSAGAVTGSAQASAPAAAGARTATATATASPSPGPDSSPGATPGATPDTSAGTTPGATSAPPSVPPATEAPATAVATATATAVMVTPPLPRRATYAYGRHPRNRIDAYWRAKKAKDAPLQPAVLILHGGSWLKGDKRAWRDSAIDLTNRGYVAFSANYRFISQAKWPAQRNDAVAAVSFIKRNAAKFGVDPNRIVILGSSAGGHLATMLGTYGAGSARVRGVVALSPVASPFLAFTDGGKPDAIPAHASLRSSVVQMIGCTPIQGDATCWPKVEDAAAATHASADDAPMLIIHSENDFVPATHGTGLRDALAAVGVPVTVKVIPGGHHGGAIVTDPQQFDAVVNWIDSLVKS